MLNVYAFRYFKCFLFDPFSSNYCIIKFDLISLERSKIYRHNFSCQRNPSITTFSILTWNKSLTTFPISYRTNFPIIIHALFKVTYPFTRATWWLLVKHKRSSVWNCDRNYKHDHNISLWHGRANNSKLFRRLVLRGNVPCACYFTPETRTNATLWDCCEYFTTESNFRNLKCM